MSSLWTPGGEHRVGDPRGAETPGPAVGEPEPEPEPEDDADGALRAELDDARQRLASVPAAQVVANHAMGLFELAAIHLSETPPHLTDAALAIDAMAVIVDSVGGRLGDSGPVLANALSHIRLAFVEVRSQAEKS
jgi:hypothetical protein